MSANVVVAGIDVGGPKKGFHVVALRGEFVEQYGNNDAANVAAWCREIGARVIGVDAPCRWSLTGRARLAERALMAKRIWCFSTPTRECAEAHPKKNFHWMLSGADLFARLESTHPLFDGSNLSATGPRCFETFPQAIACALAGRIVSAKQKRTVRRQLLRQAGLDAARFTNIDWVDAALCAVTARHFVLGAIEYLGDAASGVIVVPRTNPGTGFGNDRGAIIRFGAGR